jgi:hypothetical protein
MIKCISQMVLSIVIALTVLACGTHRQAPTPFPPETDIKTIAVLSFKDLAGVYGVGKNVRSPISGKIFLTGEVLPAAESILTENLIVLLKEKKAFEVIPSEVVYGTLPDLFSENADTLGEKELAVKTGRALKVDAVMVGYVYRFRERTGNRYAAKIPASVAFGLNLVHTGKGEVVWSAGFDETQQSLSDNLFSLSTFLNRKGEWVTARQMTASGMRHILTVFPSFEK